MHSQNFGIGSAISPKIQQAKNAGDPLNETLIFYALILKQFINSEKKSGCMSGTSYKGYEVTLK